MMEEELKFTITDDEGKEIACEALFTFESPETKKNYIVYTDNTTDEEGNTKIYASIYDPTVDNSNLTPITDDKEWKIIETVLDEIKTEFAEGKDEQ
ncbi:MAG: DUF1292 domain-containing protein [Mycoplasmatota bacterium]